MAARSTGIFPREGFNLDSSFELSVASLPAPVNVRNARTLRVIAMGVQLSGDGVFAIEIGGTIVYQTDASGLAADVDPNGVLIIHVRGFGKPNNNCGYALFPNTGSATIDASGGVFVELVDGPAR